MTIRDLLTRKGSFTATGVGGQWAVDFVGPVKLTPDGLERWKDVLGKECEVHEDEDRENWKIAVVKGIDNSETRDEVCALFNTIAGNVNAFTLAKYRELTTEEKNEDNEIRAMLAREIRRIAWLVVDGAVGSGDEGDDSEEPRDLDSMRAEIEAELANAHDMITGSLAEYEKDYEKAKREYERAKRTLESEFHKFDKKHKWTRMIEACKAKIDAYRNAGGKVEDIKTKLSVKVDESAQPSYKQWLIWVIAHFKNDEFESYFKQLDTFKKEQTSISAVDNVIRVKWSAWKDTAVKMFESVKRHLPPSTKTSDRAALVPDFSGWRVFSVGEDGTDIVSEFILQCEVQCGVLGSISAAIDEAVVEYDRLVGGIE